MILEVLGWVVTITFLLGHLEALLVLSPLPGPAWGSLLAPFWAVLPGCEPLGPRCDDQLFAGLGGAMELVTSMREFLKRWESAWKGPLDQRQTPPQAPIRETN